MPVGGVLDKEIYSRLADFKRHELSAVTEIALRGKAILAAKVTVMRYI